MVCTYLNSFYVCYDLTLSVSSHEARLGVLSNVGNFILTLQFYTHVQSETKSITSSV